MDEQAQEKKLDEYLHKLFKNHFDTCELDDSVREFILHQAQHILSNEDNHLELIPTI